MRVSLSPSVALVALQAAEELRFASRPPGRVAVSGDKSKLTFSKNRSVVFRRLVDSFPRSSTPPVRANVGKRNAVITKPSGFAVWKPQRRRRLSAARDGQSRGDRFRPSDTMKTLRWLGDFSLRQNDRLSFLALGVTSIHSPCCRSIAARRAHLPQHCESIIHG